MPLIDLYSLFGTQVLFISIVKLPEGRMYFLTPSKLRVAFLNSHFNYLPKKGEEDLVNLCRVADKIKYNISETFVVKVV